MTADIEQDNFFLGDEEREGNPETVRKADGMAAVKPAAQRMKRQVSKKHPVFTTITALTAGTFPRINSKSVRSPAGNKAMIFVESEKSLLNQVI